MAFLKTYQDKTVVQISLCLSTPVTWNTCNHLVIAFAASIVFRYTKSRKFNNNSFSFVIYQSLQLQLLVDSWCRRFDMVDFLCLFCAEYIKVDKIKTRLWWIGPIAKHLIANVVCKLGELLDVNFMIFMEVSI